MFRFPCGTRGAWIGVFDRFNDRPPTALISEFSKRTGISIESSETTLRTPLRRKSRFPHRCFRLERRHVVDRFRPDDGGRRALRRLAAVQAAVRIGRCRLGMTWPFTRASSARSTAMSRRAWCPADEAAASRAEIGRRLIAAHDRSGAAASFPTERRRRWRLLATAVAVMLVIPGIALGVYRRIGTPEAADMPLAARESAPAGNQLAEAITRVESHLVTHPDDGRGLRGSGAALSAARPLQRGRSCLRSGADPARRNGRAAGRLRPGADARGRRRRDRGRAGGVRTGGRRRPDRPRSPSSTSGLRQPRTATRPRRGRSGPRSPTPRRPAHRGCRLVKARLDALDARGGLLRQPATGPTSPAGEAIAALPADQRNSMIRGMVDGLAARLKQDGHDKDGWLKLVRAYAVLGEKDARRGRAGRWPPEPLRPIRRRSTNSTGSRTNSGSKAR